MFSNFRLQPLGAIAPFGFSEKHWPIAIAAAASAAGLGANVLSQNSANKTNLQQTRETNQTNLEIARQNNEMSQAQFNTNLQWLKEQFYKQREYALEERSYQDYASQVARMKAAGINPAFFQQQSMSTPTVGSVGGASTSSFQTPHLEAGHVEPVNYDFTGLGQAVGESVNAFYENQQKNELTKGAGYDNQIKAANASVAYARAIKELRDLDYQTEERLSNVRKGTEEWYKLQAERKEIEQRVQFQRENWAELSRQVKVGNDYTVERTAAEHANTARQDALARMELRLKPALAAANIRLSAANVQKIQAELPLLAEQVVEQVQQHRLTSEKSISQFLENRMKSMMVEDEAFSRGVRDSTHGTRAFAAFCDYLSRNLFGNIVRQLNVK